jgi:protein TonB
MERPNHDLRMQLGATAAQIRTQRVISMGVAIAILIGVGVALTLGLKQGFIQKKLEDIKVAVEKEKVIPKPPPPPPPQLKVPPPPFVPPPEIVIQSEPPPNTTAIVQQSAVKTAPPPPQIGKRPTLRGSRRSCEDLYPALDKRLSHEGVTQVRFTVTTEGEVTNAAVAKSSGFPALDAAAVDCVGRFRWNPGTNPGGQAIDQTIALNIQWNLKQQ